MERPLQHLTDADLDLLYNSLKKSKGVISNRIYSNYKNGADYDTKFAYNIVRLLLEVEQILSEGDLDLCRNSDVLKTVRAGEWSLERVVDWFDNKEKTLESLYVTSELPYKPDEDKIKQLLVECLEMHYGSLSGVINKLSSVDKVIRDIEQVIDRYK